jgi:hypothetical protein
MRIAISIAGLGLEERRDDRLRQRRCIAREPPHDRIVVISRAMAAHGTPPQKPDPQYRKQEHIIFAALALPIFAVSFLLIALIVTIGQK